LPTNDQPDLDLRALEPGDSFAGFSLGDPLYQPLKTFLTCDSKKFTEQLLARTYVLADGHVLRAYVTLVCGEIAAERDIADLDGAEYRYDHYPAIKIARLAVDKRFRKYDFGRALVTFSVGISQDVSLAAGCRFVVVDAKRPSVGFYERCGFRLIDTEENRARTEPIMFLDLKGV
jgi:GNAT superfamily N-acetyltransferase